jgi:hypothetical protein
LGFGLFRRNTFSNLVKVIFYSPLGQGEKKTHAQKTAWASRRLNHFVPLFSIGWKRQLQAKYRLIKAASRTQRKIFQASGHLRELGV